MGSNLDKYRADLQKLTSTGDLMLHDLHLRHRKAEGGLKTKEEKELARTLENKFEQLYQTWFSEAAVVLRQLLSDRHTEFVDLYRSDPRRKGVTLTTYSIQDWLNGVRTTVNEWGNKPFDDFAAVTMRFSTQLQILKAAAQRFESSLFDIRQLVQADLFDSELCAARSLAKHGFLRAAGAIAGVVLEKHLGQVASNHSVAVRKKHPGISDLNDDLKNAAVVDVPAWRQVQRLGDIRNLCDHDRKREPTPEEVEELISGVEKLTKTLY